MLDCDGGGRSVPQRARRVPGTCRQGIFSIVIALSRINASGLSQADGLLLAASRPNSEVCLIFVLVELAWLSLNLCATHHLETQRISDSFEW